jgi:thioredoxin:protein disulfide reductase
MKKQFIFLYAITTFIGAYAQFGDDLPILQFNILTSQDQIHPGDTFQIALAVRIPAGLHINSDKPNLDFMIPTEVKLNPVPDFSFSPPQFPQARMKKFSFSDDKISILQDQFHILIDVSTSPQLAIGSHTISGIFSYQGCTDVLCYAPRQDPFKTEIVAVGENVPVTKLNQDVFRQSETPASRVSEHPLLSGDELKAQTIIEKGLLYAILSFFLVGLALNLTPCVYPVIPITVSYFGSQSGRNKGSNFVHALIYQLGIALAFSFLGLLSGLAGRQWGFLFTSPWFVVFITLIILSMAASLFGSFEISVPSWLLSRMGGARTGLMGSLVMGLTVGVIIAPCAAGIIIGLVGLVAKLGLVIQGALFFFIMGMGLGLPYLVLATFSGLLNRLPQAGFWMIWVRKLFALLLIGVAIYFMMPQLNAVYDKLLFLFGFLIIFSGLFLGFLDHSPQYTQAFKKGRAVFGLALILLGLFWIRAAIHSKPAEIDWIRFQGQSSQELQKNGKPLFLDFYADWCAPCKKLEHETFPHPEIVQLAKSFNMVKVDCTVPDPLVNNLKNEWNVIGMPTLVFISRSGRESVDLRESGFIAPAQLRDRMQAILKKP